MGEPARALPEDSRAAFLHEATRTMHPRGSFRQHQRPAWTERSWSQMLGLLCDFSEGQGNLLATASQTEYAPATLQGKIPEHPDFQEGVRIPSCLRDHRMKQDPTQ